MSGWIAWMVRRGEDRFDLRVKLNRAYGPVRVLCLPAGNRSIIERDKRQRESPSSTRRIVVEPIFQRLLGELLVPILVRPESANGCFPEQRLVVRQRCAREVFQFG